jgi:hypothetical protein
VLKSSASGASEWKRRIGGPPRNDGGYIEQRALSRKRLPLPRAWKIDERRGSGQPLPNSRAASRVK